MISHYYSIDLLLLNLLRNLLNLANEIKTISTKYFQSFDLINL